MVNRKFVSLIAAATFLSLGHTADHVMRDDLRWPSTDLLIFVLVSLLLYGAIGVSLSLYVKGKVGVILQAYHSDLAGWLAVGVLSMLMLVMAVAGVYAAYLWGALSGHRHDQYVVDEVL